MKDKTKHEKIRKLIVQHNCPDNWYTAYCTRCKKAYKVNKVTRPEIDEDLQFCFDCVEEVIYSYIPMLK